MSAPDPALGNWSYCPAKAGLIHLTKTLAKRLVSENIHVNGIAPGAFPSNMNKMARDTPDLMNDKIPSGRVGNPDDMAGTALYLASKASDYMVGFTVVIDGGLATVGSVGSLWGGEFVIK